MWMFARATALRIAHAWPNATGLMPATMRNRLRRRLGPLKHASLPDRLYMEDAILPAFAARRPRRLLFVGTEAYTAHYRKWFEPSGSEFWTIDIQPQLAGYGTASRHVVGDVRELARHFPRAHFDALMLNGLLGFGLDTLEDATAAITACHHVLRPGSPLLLGWNTDRFDDPLACIAPLNTLFQPADWPDLPARKTFPDSSHVYDMLLARP